MRLPKNVWDQLKNKTANDLISALRKDGWILDVTRGAEQIYRHPSGKRVSIHYHPKKTYGQSLLKALLADIGWSTDDMKRLKFIK